MKFRKKPVVVEAYQTSVPLEIETLEGIMYASLIFSRKHMNLSMILKNTRCCNMERYVLHNLTDRQLDMLWYGLYTLFDYVKGSPVREERFGSVEEIENLMKITLHGEAEDDDIKTTT